MKKMLFALLAIIGMAVPAKAQSPVTNEIPIRGPEVVTAVVETLSSTDTVRGIDISNSAGTSVVISTSAGYRFVAVQNLDATANIYCAERSNVTSNNASNLVGIKITPGTLTYFSIRAFTDFFCINDGASSKRAAIFRGR